MKFYYLTIFFLSLVWLQTGCSGNADSQTVQPRFSMLEMSGFSGASIDLASSLQSLDELAELERSGSWIQGMALTESGIRESIGDYAGAVLAAYKELSLAYGRGLIKKNELEQGVINVLAIQGEETVTDAANAILAFTRGRWNEAAAALEPLFGHLEYDEPDGFGRWMLLVCALELSLLNEKNELAANRRRTEAAYKSIRARYVQFPEYWYRGARFFSGVIAAEFAEKCINSSPAGPFAAECRSILASYTGLGTEDGFSIKTKMEIEAIISQSVNSNNPDILGSLLPLISLPDNPYTIYAVGALRALNVIPGFRDYFAGQASVAKGRLAERLSYICRG